MIELTETELRVLGCLIEKQVTTPDNYPLSLNALTLACNQRSNRDRVVDYDEKQVVRALDGLREKKLAWMVHSAGSRVTKYEHRLEEKLALPADHVGVLCLLMLRGAQTAGELKGRTSRYHVFNTGAEVEVVLHQLSTHEHGALVVQLPLSHGAREPRFMHLLCGEPEITLGESQAPVEAARQAVDDENRRIEALEQEVAVLREAVASLQEDVAAFKSQFE